MISEVGKPSKEDLDVLFNDAKIVGLSEETVLQIFEESSVPEQIGKENNQIGTENDQHGKENEKIAKAKKSKAPKKEKDTFHSGARQRVFLANSGKFDIKQFWVSPWDMRYTTKKGKKLKARKTAGSNSDGTMDSIPKIKSVDVVKIWLRRDDRPSSKGKKLRIPTKQHWKLSKKDPSRSHEGIHGIPSHYNNPLITESHKFDSLKWEDRNVEQTFLAPVYATSRWFGKLLDQNELMLFHVFCLITFLAGRLDIARGNSRVYEPICHPKSMEMPIEAAMPDPGEWTEDWYTTWQSRKDNPNTLVNNDNQESKVDTNEDEAVPEVGNICTVRLRIGESVSRVHYTQTSYLRRSKWRRKYLTRGVHYK